MDRMMMLLTGLGAYLKSVLRALSILMNVILGGAMNQTFSARNYQRKKDDKKNLVSLIDMLLGEDHCMLCWVRWRLTEQ